MTRLKSASLVRDFGALFGTGTLAGQTDGQLLERFINRCDNVAFEELIARHGPVVLGICRRWLDDPRDVEDAFQATFLILVRKAGSLRDRSALSCWLYGVALRVVRRASANALRRRVRERPISGEPAGRGRAADECTGDDVVAIVDEEVRRLPEKQQVAVILCLLEGYTHEAAATELGWPVGTVKSRIAAARQTLTRRLTRRGLAPSGVVAMLAPKPSPVEPTSLISPHIVRLTIETARESLANPWMPTAGTSVTIASLVREVLRIMLIARIQSAVLVVLALGTLAWATPALLRARPAEKAQTAFRPKTARNADAPAPEPPRTDRYGDPLPAGAAMRLGTVRSRQAPFIKHIVFSPDGQLVVTDNGQHHLLVWDARDGKKLRQIDLGIEDVRDSVFAPDGKWIATVGFELEPKRNVVVNHLTFTDVATGQVVHRGECDDQDNVEKVAYAADGKTVATVSIDRTLRLWDVATAKLRHRERLGEGNRTTEIAFAPDAASHLLAIAGEHIDIWDVAHLRLARRIVIDREYRSDSLVFSPDGKTLAARTSLARGGGTQIWLWRVADGTLIGRFQSQKNTHVSHVSFSPDGKVLAAIGGNGGSFEGSLVFIDTATGKELDLLSSVRMAAGPLAFSPDARTLAATGNRQALHFWELATGKDRLATPEAHTGSVSALAFPADGRLLVSGSDDGTVRIWDLATGRPTKMLPHDGSVRSLAVSADGSLVGAISGYVGQGKLHVWNLKTGERLHTWPVVGATLRSLTPSGDGSSVIVDLGDGAIRRWDLSTGKDLPIAQPLPSIPSGNIAPDRRSSLIVTQSPGKSFQAGNWTGSSIGASMIVWLDHETGHVRREIEVPESHVKSLVFSPDGQSVAAGCFMDHPTRGIIRIFRLRDKKEIQTIESPCPWIEALCFTPDGKQIAAGLLDTSIVIWDVRSTD
jgi:RNA polymerase sigma factor (sigma-70 family)